MYRKAQSERAEDALKELAFRIAGLFIGLHYDTTPKKVRFGCLVGSMAEFAKYLEHQDDGTWKSVPLHEYSRAKAKGLPQVFGEKPNGSRLKRVAVAKA